MADDTEGERGEGSDGSSIYIEGRRYDFDYLPQKLKAYVKICCALPLPSPKKIDLSNMKCG